MTSLDEQIARQLAVWVDAHRRYDSAAKTYEQLGRELQAAEAALATLVDARALREAASAPPAPYHAGFDARGGWPVDQYGRPLQMPPNGAGFAPFSPPPPPPGPLPHGQTRPVVVEAPPATPANGKP